MTGIGGFFGLELKQKKEYHDKAIRLNTGRNALEYIIRAKNISKIYIPYFTCDAILQPIKRVCIDFEFYSIDKSFEPTFDVNKILKNEAFLYTNYFGIKGEYINKLKGTTNNIIIDNAHAFFALPVEGMDTFYSPRKFFGVPDGSYLYTNIELTEDIEFDVSYDRFDHLLRRVDKGAEDGYSSYLQNEAKLCDAPILQMSNLARTILRSIDYSEVASKRRLNFNYLHCNLNKINLLNLGNLNNNVPMTYPLLLNKTSYKKKFIDNKIFVPTYWSNVLSWTSSNSIEYKFADNIIHLPIDQRYGPEELNEIIKVISRLLN